MRVLQLISSSGMYGAEAVILNLARGLDASGHHSVLGVFANSAGGSVQLHHEAVARQLESHLLPCAGQFDRQLMARLREMVRERHIDVIHTHGYKADVYAYCALRRAGIPLVATCHNWLDTDMKDRAYGWLDRFVLRRFGAVAVVSKALEANLRRNRFDGRKVSLILNGVDVTPFQAAATRAAADAPQHAPLRIGLVGRLSREKGIDLFLEAAALVLRQYAEVQFILAGDGPQRGELEALAAQLGIARHVQFLGRSDTMPQLLASLDIVVSASRFEGLPMALLESMASGRPVVATDVGEVATVLDAGKAGLLVPPENVDALSHAMLALVGDPELRRTFAQRGLDRVTHSYSADTMTARYLAMYAAAV